VASEYAAIMFTPGAVISGWKDTKNISHNII
jgi:hypothetical protein